MAEATPKETHPWDQLAERISHETDRSKLLELAKELNEAMLTEERERVQHRLGVPTTKPHGGPYGTHCKIY